MTSQRPCPCFIRSMLWVQTDIPKVRLPNFFHLVCWWWPLDSLQHPPCWPVWCWCRWHQGSHTRSAAPRHTEQKTTHVNKLSHPTPKGPKKETEQLTQRSRYQPGQNLSVSLDTTGCHCLLPPGWWAVHWMVPWPGRSLCRRSSLGTPCWWGTWVWGRELWSDTGWTAGWSAWSESGFACVSRSCNLGSELACPLAKRTCS